MSRNNSGSLTGGVAGGARGIVPAISYQTRMQLNHFDAEPMARRDELDAIVLAAAQSVARDLVDRMPRDVRGAEDSQFLLDLLRKETRRAPSDKTIVRLLAIQSRADAHDRHLLSEAIRAIEFQASATEAIPVHEASEAEQSVNGPLDELQLVAAREKCPTRWQQVKEYAIRQLAATRRLIDAITVHQERVA